MLGRRSGRIFNRDLENRRKTCSCAYAIVGLDDMRMSRTRANSSCSGNSEYIHGELTSAPTEGKAGEQGHLYIRMLALWQPRIGDRPTPVWMGVEGVEGIPGVSRK